MACFTLHPLIALPVLTQPPPPPPLRPPPPVCGYYIALNLFLAILLDNFASEKPEAKPVLKRKDSFLTLPLGASSIPRGSLALGASPGTSLLASGRAASRSGLGAKPEWKDILAAGDSNSAGVSRTTSMASSGAAFSIAAESKVRGYAFLVLGPDNKVRHFLANVMANSYFESFILAIIFISSLTLALDSPRLDPASTTKAAIEVLDQIFAVLFVLEMAAKMVSLGVYFPENAYLKSPWNLLDGFISIIGIINWLITSFPPPDAARNPQQLLILRAFRTVRALRPLRMASRLDGIRIVVMAIFGSVPGMINVSLVIMLFFGIFGIIGMNLFLGMFYNCTWNPSAPQPYGDVNLIAVGQPDSRITPGVILDPNGTVILDKQWCTRGIQTITWPEGEPRFVPPPPPRT